ncbi:uncharacterized protein isoform X2 [Musca autumnalis]
MNDYWHIPRASLSPSSASSAVSSASSTQRSHRSLNNTSKLTPTHYRQQPPLTTTLQYYDDQLAQRHQQQHHHSHQGGRSSSGSRRNSEMSSYNHHHQSHAVNAAGNHIIGNKRGSRSSQGSSDSNNSTRSAASGSLLLTAANLERMTEIQRKQDKQSRHNTPPSTHNNLSRSHITPSSVYSANLLHAASASRDGHKLATISGGDYVVDVDQPDNVAAGGGKNAAAIEIDPNLNFIKTKDLDTVSIASSMHFTMVNGEAGANKKTKKGLCDRGRQVTVLIISMSTIFLLLIMGMVYALEMRAREMPQS